VTTLSDAHGSDIQREIAYLDRAAATELGRDYKRQLLAGLDLRPGHVVLDVGCGPGTDLGALAEAVGDTGQVIGVDRDPAMIETARHRTAHQTRIDLRTGDAHDLPVPEHGVDRARTDRVLQHVDDPVRVLAELRRVIRPGGLLALAEPDWDTLAVDDQDVATSREYTRFVTTLLRNPTVGRQLGRLAADAGFTVRRIDATAVVFRDFAAGEEILKFASVVERAIRAGVISADAARGWLGRLANGPFFATFTFVTAIVERH
jgi:ubiquinone/menaquinone biosynthesis C-methylase UbiE